MLKQGVRLAATVWVTAVLAGAGLAQPPPPAPQTPAPTVDAAKSSPGYILGSGDRLRVTVYGEDRLSGEYAVTTTGEISFPLIGNIKAAGRTVADLQSLIHDRLANGYLKDPRVSAEILTFRPYYVLGEVSRPGQFPYVDGLTLRQAIAAAGGFTYRAKRSQVYIMGAQRSEETKIDLKKDPGKLVAPGDTIRVGERFF